MSDTDVLNMTELAQAMRVSRNTVYAWVREGYLPEFGRRTTVVHCKKWLRDVYALKILERKKEKRSSAERLLDRLR